jgi:hypothetical protein
MSNMFGIKGLNQAPNPEFPVIIAACGSSSAKVDNGPEIVPTPISANTATTDTATKPEAQPTIQTNTQVPLVTPQPVATVVNGGAGLNPKHGEPGHRCDISEGAPLNSKPTTPNVNQPAVINPAPAPVAKQQPVVINNQPAATIAPGMNPEHGKPGHRCDIAVGAPLNSKPTVQQPAQNIITETKTASIPAPTPIQPAPVQPAANTVAAPGMNPEHGKPGHRCDIAVGAPLNSKPVAGK